MNIDDMEVLFAGGHQHAPESGSVRGGGAMTDRFDAAGLTAFGVYTPDPVAHGIPTDGEPILIEISASITTVDVGAAS